MSGRQAVQVKHDVAPIAEKDGLLDSAVKNGAGTARDLVHREIHHIFMGRKSLGEGASGPEVAVLKQVLDKAGIHLDSSSPTTLTKSDIASLSEYQSNQGLNVTRRIDRDTLNYVNADSLYNCKGPIPDGFDPTKLATIRPWEHSEAVKNAQRAFNLLDGRSGLGEDGIAGPKFAERVRDYQKEHSTKEAPLKITGRLDQATLDSLKHTLGYADDQQWKNAACPPSAGSQPSPLLRETPTAVTESVKVNSEPAKVPMPGADTLEQHFSKDGKLPKEVQKEVVDILKSTKDMKALTLDLGNRGRSLVRHLEGQLDGTERNEALRLYTNGIYQNNNVDQLVARIPFVDKLTQGSTSRMDPSDDDRKAMKGVLEEISGDANLRDQVKIAFHERTGRDLEKYVPVLFEKGSAEQTQVQALINGNIPRAEAAQIKDLQEGWTSGANQDEMIRIMSSTKDPQALVAEYKALYPKDSFYKEMVSNTDGKQEDQAIGIMRARFGFLPELQQQGTAREEAKTDVGTASSIVAPPVLRAKIERLGEIFEGTEKVVGQKADEVEKIIRDTPIEMQRSLADAYEASFGRGLLRDVSDRLRDGNRVATSAARAEVSLRIGLGEGNLDQLKETLSNLDQLPNRTMNFIDKLFGRSE